ncbi:ankyrin, partial [Gymnopus androsaceus JB14]
YTPLMIAAEIGHLDVVSVLIEEGANVNAQSEDGSTALRQASQEGHLEIVKLLLNHGAE